MDHDEGFEFEGGGDVEGAHGLAAAGLEADHAILRIFRDYIDLKRAQTTRELPSF